MNEDRAPEEEKEKEGPAPETGAADPAGEDGSQESFALADERVEHIKALIEANDINEIRRVAQGFSVADTAELLAKLDDESRKTLIDVMSDSLDPDVFVSLDEHLRNEILKQIPAVGVAGIINDLDSDDAMSLIAEMDVERQHEILRHMSWKMRAMVEEGLTFPEESAGRLMQRELVAVPQFWTVGKTIDYLRAAHDALPHAFYSIIVVDPMHHVTGNVPLDRVLRSGRAEKIEALIDKNFATVPATMDQEEVGYLFRRSGIVSAPVVDEQERLIGVITVDDVVDVIGEEAGEDLLKLSGVPDSDIFRATVSTARSRFSWLFINLLTAIAASMVIGLFKTSIEKVVALAVLMPIVASMGGNAGTQTMAVAVRALATKELSASNALRVVFKECGVGLINGGLFALIMGTVAWAWFDNPMIGFVMGSAIIINLLAAGFAGMTLPLLLEKLGYDPALSSTVFLTTVTDIVGFFAFLGLATVLLV